MLEELQNGNKDKQELYSKLVEQLNITRPEVRKIASSLRNDLREYLEVLEQGVIKN